MIVKWQEHLLRGPCDGLTSHLLGVMPHCPFFLQKLVTEQLTGTDFHLFILKKTK